LNVCLLFNSTGGRVLAADARQPGHRQCAAGPLQAPGRRLDERVRSAVCDAAVGEEARVSGVFRQVDYLDLGFFLFCVSIHWKAKNKRFRISLSPFTFFRPTKRPDQTFSGKVEK